MLDHVYSWMTSKVDYRLLTVLPWIVTVLAVFFVLFNGLNYGLEFQGGTWIEVTLDKPMQASVLADVKSGLERQGLTGLTVYVGRELASSKDKMTIVTTSMLSEADISPLLGQYFGKMSMVDVASTSLSGRPPADFADKMRSRFPNYDIIVQGNDVTVRGLDLAKEDLESAVEYYSGEKAILSLQPRNMNMKSVGPTLGKTFRDQGVKAIIWAFILMSLVIFFQFKDFVPSIAVIQSALSVPLMALAGMSLFHIPFDSASLGALLMLIGYSVDTDVLLTARVQKFKAGEVNENVDLAMRTGLMMTATTVVTMVIVILVTTFLIQITTLNTIAYVLMFGLIMDLFSTWWTNAGILKWNAGRPKSRKRSMFSFSIFHK